MRVPHSLFLCRWEIVIIDQCQIEYENLSLLTYNKLGFTLTHRYIEPTFQLYYGSILMVRKSLYYPQLSDWRCKRIQLAIKWNLKRMSSSPLQIKITMPKMMAGVECPCCLEGSLSSAPWELTSTSLLLEVRDPNLLYARRQSQVCLHSRRLTTWELI